MNAFIFSFILEFGEMSRIILIVFCLSFHIIDSSSIDSCTTLSGEAGDCVFLHKCRVLMEAFQRDRNNAPTVCHRESRKICCPLKYMSQPENIDKENDLDSRGSVPEEDRNETREFEGPEIERQCIEFRSLLFNNQTTHSYIFGEEPKIIATPFCNQNKANNGLASEKEFPHVAVIKVENLRFADNNFFNRESKCVGSLISDRHVITSFHCVFSTVSYKITVYFGVFDLNSIEDGQQFDIETVDANFGLSVLTLSKKVEFSEKVLPICIHSGKDFSPPIVLAGWTGDWRECDPKLKKWHIDQQHMNDTVWNFKVAEAAIINYRQALMIGSPLQIYHPEGFCQYSLIGLFEHLTMGNYNFNNLSRKLRWIENIVWPKSQPAQNFNVFRSSWRLTNI